MRKKWLPIEETKKVIMERLECSQALKARHIHQTQGDLMSPCSQHNPNYAFCPAQLLIAPHSLSKVSQFIFYFLKLSLLGWHWLI